MVYHIKHERASLPKLPKLRRVRAGPGPPSEAQAILLRITRCYHWNKCAFCPVYKHEQYSIRKVDEIERDIDAMAAVADRVRRRMDGACGAGNASTASPAQCRVTT